MDGQELREGRLPHQAERRSERRRPWHRRPRRARLCRVDHLLATLLDEAAHELLGVLLQDFVDLVEQGVDIGVERLLACRGGRVRRRRRRLPAPRPGDRDLVVLAGLAALTWTSRMLRRGRPMRERTNRSATPSDTTRSTLVPLRRSLTCDTAGQGGDELPDAAHPIQERGHVLASSAQRILGRDAHQRAASRARRR